MMLREMNRRTLLSLVALVILVILSAATLDYSGLSTFSPSMGMDVLRGLGQPDWQFLYDLSLIHIYWSKSGQKRGLIQVVLSDCRQKLFQTRNSSLEQLFIYFVSNF